MRIRDIFNVFAPIFPMNSSDYMLPDIFDRTENWGFILTNF